MPFRCPRHSNGGKCISIKAILIALLVALTSSVMASEKIDPIFLPTIGLPTVEEEGPLFHPPQDDTVQYEDGPVHTVPDGDVVGPDGHFDWQAIRASMPIVVATVAEDNRESKKAWEDGLTTTLLWLFGIYLITWFIFIRPFIKFEEGNTTCWKTPRIIGFTVICMLVAIVYGFLSGFHSPSVFNPNFSNRLGCGILMAMEGGIFGVFAIFMPYAILVVTVGLLIFGAIVLGLGNAVTFFKGLVGGAK